MAKRLDPLLEFPSSIDVLYLLGLIAAFVSFSFVRVPVLYVIYPVLIWSIYQDWRSARVAQKRRHLYFLLSDLLTIFNYVSLFVALTLPGHPELGYSEKIWLHWGAVFLIYIVWNLVMRALPDTDAQSRKFFLNYSLVEMPIVVFCFLVFFEAKTRYIFYTTKVNILAIGNPLLISMGFIHFTILTYWVYQTYIASKSST